MKSHTKSRFFGHELEDNQLLSTGSLSLEEQEDTSVMKTVGWISAGLGAVALGLFLGRELRQRYKFNRRTPYDFYAHAGDEQDVEVGLGI